MNKYFFILISFTFPLLLPGQKTWQQRAEEKAINTILDYYASLNNYCDIDYSLDDRIKFKDHILISYLKPDKSILANDLIGTGSRKYTGEQYLDNLKFWFPYKSTEFKIENLKLSKTGINDQGFYISYEFIRKINGIFNTKEKIINSAKLTAFVFFPNNKISEAYIEKIEITDDELKKIFKDKDELTWENALKNDNIGHYEQYLEEFPSGKHKVEAFSKINELMVQEENNIKTQIENRKWELAKSYNTIQEYEKYISKYPNGQYVKTAKLNIEKLKILVAEDEKMWKNAQNENSIEKYNEYIKKFPEGKFIVNAIKAARQIKQDNINTEKQNYDIVSKTTPKPNNNNEQQKKQVINVEKAKDSFTPTILTEESEYKAAINNNNLKSYRDYLKKYPNGKFESQINKRINIIDRKVWNKSKYLDNLAAYFQYFILFPNGNYRTKVIQKIKEHINIETDLKLLENILKNADDDVKKDINIIIKDVKSWIEAKKINTSKSYKEYLNNFPNGKYRTKATIIIDNLDWETAKQQNTYESYKEYRIWHSNGKYAKKAHKEIKKIRK